MDKRQHTIQRWLKDQGLTVEDFRHVRHLVYKCLHPATGRRCTMVFAVSPSDVREFKNAARDLRRQLYGEQPA